MPDNCNLTPAEDMLEGARAIADHLGWKGEAGEQKVYTARHKGWTIPIRKREGLGLYAFKSELDAWLKADETLPAPPSPISDAA